MAFPGLFLKMNLQFCKMNPLQDELLHTALLAQEKGLRFSLNGTNLLTIIDALTLPCVPLSTCYFSCLSASSLYITARTVSNTCTTAWILFHLESSTIKQIALNCVSQSSLGMRMQPDSLLEYIMNGFENILERIPVPSLKSREFGLHGHLKSQLNST